MSTRITQYPYQREHLAVTMPASGTCVVAHGQMGRAAFATAQTNSADLVTDTVPSPAAAWRTEVNGGAFVRVYGPPGRVFDLTTLHVLGVTSEPAPTDDRLMIAPVASGARHPEQADPAPRSPAKASGKTSTKPPAKRR